MPDKRVVFGSAYQAMWAWVRETDPNILAALVDSPDIDQSDAVHLNGYSHLWFEVRSAARHILEDGAHPYFT
jgi:hypothetical protein